MPADRNALLDHFRIIEGIDPARNSAKKRAVAGVAQLVEHPICNRAVGSSSLSASTISKDPRSEFRGSSDCFQTINVLEQEFELLWCG